MKKIQILFFTFLLCLFAADVCAQKQDKVSGKILSSLNTPVKGAVCLFAEAGGHLRKVLY